MEQKWLLTDMHLHSQFSKMRKEGDKKRVKAMTPKEFVDILHEKNVEVFSITDHNFFAKDYYDEVDNYIESKNLKMKLINGAELDVYVELSGGKFDYIHLCFYFEDLVNREKLSNIIEELYFDQDGNSLSPTFSDILNKFSELNCKFIVIPHGDKTRGLFEVIKNLQPASAPEFYKYAMYKIFNAFDVKENFITKSHDFWAAEFYEKTKSFTSVMENKKPEEIKIIEENIVDKMKGKPVSLNDEEFKIYNYILSYGSLFAYFSFSDWHNAEVYCPLINNFIFGTLEFAFESFEMSTLDPLSRIVLSKDEKIEIPATLLRKVEFDINESHKEIFFSPGLNAIVGKRGSGKSLLLSVIKNLVDQDDSDGALKKYNSLNVRNITAENRGGINISLGSFNSVAFLTQEEIKEIFEDPTTAQKNIAKYFIDIRDIDLSKIYDIIKVGRNIVPYNKNYKSLTSNILSIKKIGDFNFSDFDRLDNIDLKLSFNKIINNFEDVIQYLDDLHIDYSEIKNKLKEIRRLRDYYLKMIDLYNDVIIKNNNRIYQINSEKTDNQTTNRQNLRDIQTALEYIKENLTIRLNVEKLRLLLDNFSMNNPEVEVNKKGKYLFVTYYQIPNNIKDEITTKILESITRANKFEDIYKFVDGDDSRHLKANVSNLMDILSKFSKEDIFKAKKEFYEIVDKSINYVDEIKNMNDLQKFISKKSIVNLTNASPGMKSVAYLDMLFDLDDTILILDQPEDNIDNDYISNCLVPNIKDKKKIKQLIFVTHNPSVAVYGDAFNYIYVENKDGDINYTNYLIEKFEDKKRLMDILEGGRYSFSNRNKKFGNILGDEEYGYK